uniref:Uncharacterized protein n=1 Tax=Candidatus Methanophaga sp. ANME-1 ERB7 TaxID=2759913 RepID=A0A7G9Z1K5_9EURY|nr:hypothetical protein KOBOILMI_00007 [Methanosarcinales archaeon ANME-1 ERB7]
MQPYAAGFDFWVGSLGYNLEIFYYLLGIGFWKTAD